MSIGSFPTSFKNETDLVNVGSYSFHKLCNDFWGRAVQSS